MQTRADIPFWNDRKNRAVVYQAVTIVAVIAAIAFLSQNAIENMARLKIASGFGFWSTEAGFDITMSLIAYDEASSYGRAFVVGLLNTVLVSAIGIAFATVFGFTIGIARLSGNWLIARLAAAYIETLRNIPLLLQLFFWYFAVLRALPSPRRSWDLADAIFLNNRGLYLPAPDIGPTAGWLIFAVVLVAFVAAVSAFRARKEPRAFGMSLLVALGLPAVGMLVLLVLPAWEAPALKGFNFRGGIVLIPELVALVLALSIYTAAFIAENVRSGIQAVSVGQVEAARSLGLSRGQTLRSVVVPQALRVIIPPLTNQYLNLTKNSSLAAAIAYPDLVSVFAGTVLNQTGQAVEVIAITMAVYLFISVSISILMNLYNRWVTRTGF